MTPWWANGSWDYVSSRLSKSSIVFEWGSGNSTKYLSKLCNRIISIENDHGWFDKLKIGLDENIELRFIPAGGNAVGDPSDVNSYSSKSVLFGGRDFSDYVKVIDIYPDGYFDLVVVDGRSRTSCIAHAIKKVSKGGMLLIDDLWREHYKNGIDLIPNSWHRINFKSPSKFTGIWISI